MTPIITTYLFIFFLLAVLPINGTHSALNNNYLLSIRWDYLVHALVYIPLYPIMMLQNIKTSKAKLQTLNLKHLIIALLLAITLEAIQYLTPWRAFNINDMMANALGVGVGVIVWQFLKNNKRIIE